eukprot:10739741-Ditylum_brightwellii.AAC.1
MEMDDPIVFAAKHDPVTMYFHQARALTAYTNRRGAQGNQNLGCCVVMKQKKDIKTSQNN